MDIITKKTDLKKSFWLYFHLLGDGTEWIEYNLPNPSILKHINKGYFIGWAVDGYFGTKKGQDFLNDIIARFLLTFKDQDIKRLSFKPNLEDKTAHILAKAYKLKEFSKELKSLPVKRFAPKRADKFDDFTFWAIKLYAEDLIRMTGFIVYESLETWSFNQFLGHKERSTIRAKCRSVFNWYEERDFKIYSPKEKKYETIKLWYKESKMTRAENMKRVKKEEESKNRRKVINVITSLLSVEYKKRNGKWNITKIAKDTNLSRPTVIKFIKEFEESSSYNKI